MPNSLVDLYTQSLDWIGQKVVLILFRKLLQTVALSNFASFSCCWLYAGCKICSQNRGVSAQVTTSKKTESFPLSHVVTLMVLVARHVEEFDFCLHPYEPLASEIGILWQAARHFLFLEVKLVARSKRFIGQVPLVFLSQQSRYLKPIFG